jgi:hypothetical protein
MREATIRQGWALIPALLASLLCLSCLAPSGLEQQTRLESTVVAMQTDVAMELAQLRELVLTPAAPPTGAPSPTLDPSIATHTPMDASAHLPEGMVTADILNLRGGPGLEYDVIGHLQRGDTVQARARLEAGDWVKVASSGGVEGWVATEFVALKVPMASIPLAVQVPPTPITGPTARVTPTPALGPTVSVTPMATSVTPQG